MVKHSVEHLIKMMNQIARSVPAVTPEARAEAAAAHIDKFWTPSMKQQICEQLTGAEESLTPVAVEAIKIINQ